MKSLDFPSVEVHNTDMEINRTTWAEAVELFLAGVTVEVVRIVTPTADVFSPAARERNGYVRGTRTTFTTALFLDGQFLDFSEISDVVPIVSTRKAAESFDIIDAVRSVLLDEYWTVKDGQAEGTLAGMVSL
jgi:hypothetical protein